MNALIPVNVNTIQDVILLLDVCILLCTIAIIAPLLVMSQLSNDCCIGEEVHALPESKWPY